MKKTDTTEKGLESLIMRHMTGTDGLALDSTVFATETPPARGGNGWFAGKDSGYDREVAVDWEQLFAFLSTTQPDEWAKLGIASYNDVPGMARQKFLARLQGEFTRQGYPVSHPTLGLLPPSPDVVAKALAGSGSSCIQPTGAYAANLLGLSTQVPAKIVYLTDGASRLVQIGNQEIRLKQTTPKNMATAGRISGLIIQAFRYFGKAQVDDAMAQSLKRRLSDKDKKQLRKDIRYAPAWIGAWMRKIAEDAEATRKPITKK